MKEQSGFRKGCDSALRKKRGALRTIGISLSVILLVVLGAFIIYTSDYSKADKGMVASISQMKGASFDSGRIVLEPEKPNGTGIVFYPGGKVEYTVSPLF